MATVYCVTYAGQTGVVKCFKSKKKAEAYADRRSKAERAPFDYGIQPCKVE